VISHPVEKEFTVYEIIWTPSFLFQELTIFILPLWENFMLNKRQSLGF